MLKRISIFWIILGALLLTSAVPLIIIAYRSITTTSAEVEREQKQQLRNRVEAHADAINEQFRQFEITTNVAANRVRELLTKDVHQLTEDELATRLANYRKDQFGIYGLDAYYLEKDGRVPSPEQYDVSNVYVNKFTELSPELQRVIAATEALDALFLTIRSEKFGSQWLYVTTQEMMRLFPWHPNQYGPPSNWAVWDPWTILFYTAASDQGIYILQNVNGQPTVVQHITGDNVLRYFRNPDILACSGNDDGTCIVNCSASGTLQGQYCKGREGIVLVQNFAASDLTATLVQANDTNTPVCDEDTLGSETCYVPCSETANPLRINYCGTTETGGYTLTPVTAAVTTSEPMVGINKNQYSACGSNLSSTACYLDCTDYTHPLHETYCRGTVWTPPYYDFAGQGLMVTNSLPVYDNDNVIAVMSHDLRIDVMEQQVLNVEVGDEGFAFLLDTSGQIIAHRDYSPAQFAAEAKQGEPQFLVLAESEPDIASLVARMTSGETGVSNYKDKAGVDWIVAYTTIPSTGWHLGLAQPRSEIIAPATKIQTQVITGVAVMVLAVLGMSVLLARNITRPVLQLSKVAKEIEATVDMETSDVVRQNLSNIGNISTAREINNLAGVFEQMVMALQQRMVELNSIYAMGQTITANVDYDDTMKAVLNAVGNVVTYDAAEITIPKGTSLVVEAWQGSEGFNDTTGRKYKIGRGPTGQIAETKQSVLLSTVTSVEDMERTLGYGGAPGSEFLAKTTKIVINSFLGIPLLIGDRLIGTLTLVHRDKEHFTPNDERQLNKLAAQASVAIQNAIQVREREQTLKRQIEELKIEIDQAKLAKQVEEVTDSDFFRNLQRRAAGMRKRFEGREGGEEGDEAVTDAPDEPKKEGEE